MIKWDMQLYILCDSPLHSRYFPDAISLWRQLGWGPPAAPSSLLPTLLPPAAPDRSLPLVRQGCCPKTATFCVDLRELWVEDTTHRRVSP